MWVFRFNIEGDSVVMLTAGKWKPAEVTRRHDTPRSYVVQTSDDRKHRRNRKHLRPTNYREDPKRDNSIDDHEWCVPVVQYCFMWVFRFNDEIFNSLDHSFGLSI
jgi:hypothetical protein